MSRTSRLLTALLVSLIAIVPATATAATKKKPHRHGGTVQKAWPANPNATPPDNALAKWLAGQVGPVSVASGTKTQTPSSQTGTVARAARAATAAASTASGDGHPVPVAFAAAATSASNPLLLVRSFDIPTTDPGYSNLANLSWTYDNGLAALAFTDLNYRAQAEQLLDQLKALQLSDGSLAFAYAVNSGAASGAVRTNALAWVGIAAVEFRDKYNDTSYDGLIGGIAKYLFTLRRSDGLLTGGPDVSWVSTQHNILAAEFFRKAGIEFGSRSIGNGYATGTQLTAQYNTTAAAITSKLIVQAGSSTAYFVQGLNDARIPLDVQAFGSVFLKNRNDARAAQVGAYMLANFYDAPRTVSGVSWSGFRPFAGSAAPDVIWSEGTIETSWALSRLGINSSIASAAVLGIYGTTKSGTTGPLGANVAVDSTAWGQFPSWPASAPGSWLLILAGGSDALFD